MMRRIKRGDVFYIPGLDGVGCLSQVIKLNIVFYIKVYSPLVVGDTICIGDFNSDAPLFLIAETTDGDYKRGVWRLLGNAEVKDFTFPYHVVDNGESMVVRNFDNEVVRVASEDDVARYGYRHSVSSPVVSNAVRRRCKDGPDVDYFDIDARRVLSKCIL